MKQLFSGHGARRLRLLALTGLLVVVACIGGARRQSVTPTRSLTPALKTLGEGASGKFRVVFSAPAGQAATGAEISLVFDRPLQGLGSAAPAPKFLSLSPEVPGEWHWVGARALRFAPASGALPNATSFTVVVPGSLRALDGSELGAEFRWSFETPRPQLVNSEPRSDEIGILPNAELVVLLNQRVSPEAVSRFGRLDAGKRELAFSVARPQEKDPKRLVVRPKQRLPLDSQIVFTLSPDLLGEEGPLPTGQAQSFSFHTLGPMRVQDVECNHDSPHGHCMPGYGLGLSFSNPARYRDLERAIQLIPAVPRRRSGGESDDGETTYFELPATLAPGRTYSVRVAAGLKDIYGQKLEREFRREIVMDDLFPRVAIGVGDGTVVPADRAPIPVAAVNAQDAVVRYAALSPNAITPAQSDTEQIAALLGSAAHTQNLRLPSGPRNRPVRATLDPTSVLGPGASGVLAMSAAYDADERDSDRPTPSRLTKLSDLAITAKLSRHGSQIWVTRLSDARAVSGADVELLQANGRRQHYATDPAGLARIPAQDFAPNLAGDSADRKAILIVRAGQDWTFERVSDVLEPWALPVPTDESGQLHTDGLLFSDRDLYRPADTVRVKGVVRRQTARGSALPKGERVTLSLRTPDDQEIRKLPLTVSAFGTFNADFKLPAAAPLGSYLLVARIGQDSIERRISVEEFRPTEFEVEISAPSQATRGDRTPVQVHGQYLFGAAMADAPLRYQFIRSPTWFHPKASDGLVTTSDAYYADLEQVGIDSGDLGNAQVKLDAQGNFQTELSLLLANQRGPERVTIDAEATDLGRQTSSSNRSVLVHPAEFYLGLQEPGEWFVQAPSRVMPRVVALTAEGQRVGARKIHLDLIERRWTFAREDRGGAYPAIVSKVVDRVAASCEAISATAPVGCPLPLDSAGYYLVRAKSTDARGNPVEAALGMYAIGAGEPSFRTSDDNTVALVLDKKSYRVGDTARVLIKSPFPESEALISVERADLQYSERRSLKGAAPTIELKVTEDMRPNAFVSVALSRPLPKGTARVPGAAFRIGYATLEVEPDSRRLKVEVLPSSSELEPGDTARVNVRVHDANGKPAASEVTLYAVDEGVLLLSGYTVPDPLEVFARARPLQVSTLETRLHLTQIMPESVQNLLGIGKGAEGGGGGEGVRRNFLATAYFNPSLVSDAQGQSSASFRLPDNLTSYRVMAVAVGDTDRFGFGSAKITASRRLMARPALPRFLRAGDEANAGVIVSAKRFDPGVVSVSARAEGVSLIGAASQSLHLPANGQAEVRFRLRAEQVGDAKLTFDVRGGNQRDVVEVRRAIMLPLSLEATALSGQTNSSAAEAIKNLGGLRHDVGGVEISLASSALVGLDAVLKTLIDYPYGCSEQLASALLPLGPLADLSRDFGVSVTPELSKLRDRRLAELVARQRHDGGFALWPESRSSEPWVSAYVSWVLNAMKAHGAEVPPRVLSQAEQYLRTVLASGSDRPRDLAAMAYAVDVLAELGAPDPGYMNRLFQARKQLPLFARALLLHAFVKAKQAGPESAALLSELEGQIRLTGSDAVVVENLGDDYAALMDSNARTHALVLRALLAASPRHPLLVPLTRGLLAQRRGGSFRNTQESAFSLVALAEYRKTVEAPAPEFQASVELGGRTLVEHRFSGRSPAAAVARVSWKDLLASPGSALQFNLDGRGTLFYEARLRYASAELPKAALDAGFFVEKGYRTVQNAGSATDSGGELPLDDAAEWRVPPGTLVETELHVVSAEPREYVVIDDPLPAGFEAIDTQLATTSLAYARHLSAEQRADDQALESNARASGTRDEIFDRRELRDDRVVWFINHMTPGIYRFRYLARTTTLGRFLVPPTRAEAMYAPEVFGRTATRQVEIR